jgi:hypothetical protein
MTHAGTSMINHIVLYTFVLSFVDVCLSAFKMGLPSRLALLTFGFAIRLLRSLAPCCSLIPSYGLCLEPPLLPPTSTSANHATLRLPSSVSAVRPSTSNCDSFMLYLLSWTPADLRGPTQACTLDVSNQLRAINKAPLGYTQVQHVPEDLYSST